MSGIDHLCKTCIRIRQGYCDGAEPEDRECQFYKRMTNADKIRQMTDEELALLIGCPVDMECEKENIGEPCCFDCTLNWLKQEVEE